MRVRSIDAFRGLAIVLMVFFTLTFVFSRSLPDLITHNVAGSLHLGDFVLPLFLFASGMSLVFFHEKRKGNKAREYILDVIERFGKLVLISFFISPFSAGGFLQMDEVMLSAVLFLVCILLIGLPDTLLVLIALAVFGLYFALSDLSLLPDFSAYYLGGYPAAIFYLPVMLGGVIAGKRVMERKELTTALLGAGMLFVVLLLIVPPYKSDATPSFMALSILLSLVVFVLVETALKQLNKKREGVLEYLGRQPIRYWVLMFVMVKIPVEVYAFSAGLELPLELGWTNAVLIAVVCVPVLYAVSKGIDLILLKPQPKKKR
ncbi:MAG: heparan-alpha-glucosaminide N-acetyltransferase domain-containing protein [Candidatus ainarchaeum sp.]|nr:heparan-alpha-glucosaminide N-acetyltransferase domain-containing protein [Candidatus ainarchaeum sp.]